MVIASPAMSTRSILLVVLACLSAGLARGETRGDKIQVKTVDSLAQVVPFLNNKTLLVVDIDNTLLEPTQSLGSDQWYRYLLRRYRERGLTAPAAQERAIAVWNRVQDRIKVRPVEPDAPRLLRTQQDRGVYILGLTARSLAIAPRTLKQLESIGIQLGRRPFPPRGHRLYRHGILFAGEGNDKGALLVGFLRGRRPARVVFVDDRQENVDGVARALGRAAIPAIVFRYAAVDGRVRAFEADLADPELFINGEPGQRR